METIIISKDSKIAKFFEERTLHQEAIKNYINGIITLEELKKSGVKLVEPINF